MDAKLLRAALPKILKALPKGDAIIRVHLLDGGSVTVDGRQWDPGVLEVVVETFGEHKGQVGVKSWRFYRLHPEGGYHAVLDGFYYQVEMK